MNAKLSFIYLNYTGHILSSLTRAVAPEIITGRSNEMDLANRDLEQLVGDKLFLTYLGTSNIFVPSDALQIYTTDFKDSSFDVLYRPTNFYVDVSAQIKTPLDVPNRKPTLNEFKPQSIKIALPEKSGISSRPVWIMLYPYGGDMNEETRIFKGTFDSDSTEFAVSDIQLNSGTDYDVLVLIFGYKLFCVKKQRPKSS